MSMFAYRTIGNESPLGKPRIYFACHPDDLAGFLEDYALKILRIQNCAIWYETEYDAPYSRKELEARLAEMQLIVMPVTTKLLTRPNRAMDVEFAIAQERHIPVLPIMMEEDLTDVFTKRFGNIQYIDPNEKDPTKRSFEEVLETHLKAVLAGEELAEKVRAAFDAYIFLSYRKKDRAQAQKLMRLIHKNPICRDIAIWYDEFLTPGEDFNDLISSMLKKSDIFALTVTPNLINEINYVMTTEYPAARKGEKPVLPVEMEPTDREDLRKNYEDIPECVESSDEEALLAALKDLLHIVAISEDAADPDHCFLIGMAYLDGIDVEVDHERAVKLITMAAGAGVPEAMEQLVTMYESGKGVARDYHEGIRWRREHVSALRGSCGEDPDAETLALFVQRLEDLGDALYELRLPEEAGAVYQELLSVAKRFEDRDIKYRRLVSISYSKTGSMAIARGRLKEARRYFEKSLEIRLDLAKDPGTPETRRDLSISYNRLGDLAREQGRLEEAKDYFEKCLAIRLDLAEDPGTMEARRDLSISYNSLGDLAREQGKLEEAKDCYEKCLSIRLALAAETDTAKARRDLSISYNKLGDLAMKQLRPEEAKGYYEKGLRIRLALAGEEETVKARRDLSISYDKLGDIAEAQGKWEEAEEYYQKCLDIRLGLSEETDTVKARRDLSISYNKLGDIAMKQGRWEKAGDCYEKGLEIRLALAGEEDTVKARRDLSISYDKLGDIAKARGRLEEAKSCFEKCLEIRLVLAEEAKAQKIQRDLTISFNKLGDIALAQGRLEEARSYYEKGLRIRLMLADQAGTVRARRDLSRSYQKMGDIALAQGNREEAREWYEKSREVR